MSFSPNIWLTERFYFPCFEMLVVRRVKKMYIFSSSFRTIFFNFWLWKLRIVPRKPNFWSFFRIIFGRDLIWILSKIWLWNVYLILTLSSAPFKQTKPIRKAKNDVRRNMLRFWIVATTKWTVNCMISKITSLYIWKLFSFLILTHKSNSDGTTVW